ncbi:MAG: SCP2 sterol-binding domain-containing protein [Reichenbachiella sp.]
MTLESTTQKVTDLAASKGGQIKAKLKFKFEEGIIFLDDTQTPAIVSNEDGQADCVMRLSLQNFNKLMSGDLNPMGAYMMGKIKIDGDMSIAMKLSSLF